MKLHLGCGEKYLNGYINIDFPSEEHTVQKKSVADKLSDIRTLSFDQCSIDEVRSHHFFEHFSRQDALALLCRWTNWLKPGGIIRIETPDFYASIKQFLWPLTNGNEKAQILRHLFGSHEASWAAHWDGWHEDRFRNTLKLLGYKQIRFEKNKWGATRNIEVFAIRGRKLYKTEDYYEISKEILSESLIQKINSDKTKEIDVSELNMLEVWMAQWLKAYQIN